MDQTSLINVLRCSALRCSALRCSALRCSALRCSSSIRVFQQENHTVFPAICRRQDSTGEGSADVIRCSRHRRLTGCHSGLQITIPEHATKLFTFQERAVLASAETGPLSKSASSRSWTAIRAHRPWWARNAGCFWTTCGSSVSTVERRLPESRDKRFAWHCCPRAPRNSG